LDYWHPTAQATFPKSSRGSPTIQIGYSPNWLNFCHKRNI